MIIIEGNIHNIYWTYNNKIPSTHETQIAIDWYKKRGHGGLGQDPHTIINYYEIVEDNTYNGSHIIILR